MKNLEAFDLNHFRGKSHLKEDDTETFFVFQPIYRYFKTVNSNNANILSWKSKGLSDQSIKAPTTPSKFLNRSLNYVGSKIRVRCTGDCLKQERLSFNHEKIVNIYIA